MALNVISIDPKATAKAEVVEMAKVVLARAEAGEFVDFTYCAALADGSMQTGFTRTEDGPRRPAAVSRLLHRLHQTWDEM